jgi:glycosyltransferase involved in cell wall biosynthesis
MRILALYPFLPYPAAAGSKLRGAAVLDILTAKHEVIFASLLAREDSAAQLLSWELYPRFAQEPLTVSREVAEDLSPSGKALRAKVPKPRLGMPHWMEYFDLPAMWNRLAELDLNKIDAVHVRYVSMTPYALALKRAAPHLRLVVDLDDILSVIFLRKLAFPKKLSQVGAYQWELRQIVRMYGFERGELRKFDYVWVCSEHDLRKIGRRVGIERSLIVPNVVNAAKLAAIHRQGDEPALLFIGDFNYHPNSQAAEFFVTKVWPVIRAKVPAARLWLVGSNRQAKILAWNSHDGISVTGAVDSVTPYLERAMISIAPLLVGVGTRLKILEALGVGLPVVTTTIGVEGIDARDGSDLLVADAPEDFAGQCIRLLEDGSLRARLAAAGKHLIKEKYDISVMAKSIDACYDGLERGAQS